MDTRAAIEAYRIYRSYDSHAVAIQKIIDTGLAAAYPGLPVEDAAELLILDGEEAACCWAEVGVSILED
jgi:hypothetical protein|tara:strand:- start:338 stop:544 length:207 start_codon:yes stop_codon:yes gene_type:complete